MTSVAMYYPHIHFRSRAWLRSAALYYDQITRIVPDGMEPDVAQDYFFTQDAERLAADAKELTAAGVIRNVPPDQSSVTAASDDFLKFASANFVDPVRRRSVLAALHRRNREFYIHPSKINPTVLEILRELGLAREAEHDRYGDWTVDAAAAVLYLICLSHRMSKGKPLVTDNIIYDILLHSENPIPEGSKIGGVGDRLVSILFESVVPDLDRTSLKDVLKFRDKHGPALSRLQEQLHGIEEKLSKVNDEDDLNRALQRQASLIEQEKGVLKDKLSVSRLGTYAGLFVLTVPAPIKFVAPNHPIALAGGVIAMISLAARKFVLDRRITKNSSPWSYLIDVEKEFRRTTPRWAEALTTLDLDSDEDEDRVSAY